MFIIYPSIRKLVCGFRSQSMSPQWWIYPFKPVKVDFDIFDRIKCEDYTMEVKLDGWRIEVIKENEKITCWTRDKKRIEVPDRIIKSLKDLNIPDGTMLDGEIWDPNKRGGWTNSKNSKCEIALWDVIRISREDMRLKPIETRRETLSNLVKTGTDVKIVKPLETKKDTFLKIFDEAKKVRNESRSGFIHGVVLKKINSIRRDTPNKCTEHPDWLKVVFPGMEANSFKI